MSLFRNKENESFQKEMNAIAISRTEVIRRREFCMSQAAFICDEERPSEVIRIAEMIYSWVYETE